MPGNTKEPEPKRVWAKPIVVSAPGESEEDCVNRVIAFDNWLSEQLEKGNFRKVERPDGTIDIVRS